MDYKVIMSDLAESQLDRIIYYILYKLKNEQAARSLLEDSKNTQMRLSHIAGNLKLCDNPRLHALGYRIIHFERHQYLMVYKIVKNEAHVEGIYHDLQNYESILQ